jgi:enoyl-CoA hydratase/carnithine racemase
MPQPTPDGASAVHDTYPDDAVVLVELVDHRDTRIAVLTLNRPSSHNPVDEQTIAALEEAISDVVADTSVRALAITGAGESFSSGGDLKGYQALFRDRARFERFVAAFGRVCCLLERSSIPTAAMVNGTCMAGGMELALSCDLIFVAEEARIGDGHLRFSQMPGSGAQRLVRAIGLQRARHWLLTGDLHPGRLAVEAGLATAAPPLADLRTTTLDELARICRASPLALAGVKHLVVTAQTTPLDEGLRIEEETAVGYATGSADAIEGITAFAERRPPRFTGR